MWCLGKARSLSSGKQPSIVSQWITHCEGNPYTKISKKFKYLRLLKYWKLLTVNLASLCLIYACGCQASPYTAPFRHPQSVLSLETERFRVLPTICVLLQRVAFSHSYPSISISLFLSSSLFFFYNFFSFFLSSFISNVFFTSISSSVVSSHFVLSSPSPPYSTAHTFTHSYIFHIEPPSSNPPTLSPSRRCGEGCWHVGW